VKYLLTLGTKTGGLNRLVATGIGGHTLVVTFESSRWMEAILNVVGKVY